MAAPMTPNAFCDAAVQLGDNGQRWQDAELKLRTYYQNRFPAHTPPPGFSWEEIVGASQQAASQGDWNPMIANMNAALRSNGLQDTSEIGACVYWTDGQPRCANMTQDQCLQLGGSWNSGTSCPVPVPTCPPAS